MPVPGVAGLLDQILEGLGIKSIVHLILAEGGFDAAVDVGLRGGDPRPFAGSRDAGMTSAARMPMMVTTSRISTSVNALRDFWFCVVSLLDFHFHKFDGYLM